MRKYLIITIIATANCILPTADCFSQAPEIEWENTIGGNWYDLLYSVDQTSDGGYILGGTSESEISVDKSEPAVGYTDYWIVKTDASGTIEWQNTIGTVDFDELRSVHQTSDGGYIVAGHSRGGVSGDKTSNNNGGDDYWIIKLDAIGNILFQKDFGGDSYDILQTMILTSDGGFLLAGTSESGATDDKTEPSQGGKDYWVIKLGSSGKIQWQNTIGGNADDELYDAAQSSDGGYILAGYSYSGISGDKTEANLGIGYADYWIVKINSTGDIEWQNTLGGNFDDFLKTVTCSSDGGFVLGGRSSSANSPDKSESSLGSQEPWVVKVNASGSIIWENTIEETSGIEIISIEPTIDGGYILGGGQWIYWVCKLTGSGDVDWWDQFGGGGILKTVIPTEDQGFFIGGSTLQGISADKSEPSFGVHDYWVLKLYPDVCIPVAEICNSMDDDCNGLIDDSVVETISITADGPTTICSGDELDLMATHSGTSIQWKKNGANILGATSSTYSATTTGTYSAQTSSDCDTEISNEIFVQVNKKPNAFISAGGSTIFCAGGSVTLTANTGGGLSYQWYKGASAIAGATNINYVATTTGNYKCLVTKIVSGCNKQSNAIAVSVPCREDEINSSENNSFTLYPNPANDKLNIQINSQLLSPFSFLLTITDLQGREIYTMHLNSPTTEINISDFASGMYFVKVIPIAIGRGEEMIEKFIKN